MSRARDRSDMDQPTRIRLLETDADEAVKAIEHTKGSARTQIDAVDHKLSNQLAELRADMRTGFKEADAKMDAGFKECETRDEGTRKLLTALLISIVTLCIAVTVGVLVALGGG